ncbi:MAG TPA: hypothetical protein VG963_14565, partial [Polyangiaceae bacterium]|nr:hypothetical protein [Polyangiaceae bacterium]
MAKESRKITRASEPAAGSVKPSRNAAAAVQVEDPLSPERLKSMALRLGLPLLGAWLLGALVAGIAHTTAVQAVALGIPAALTVAAVVLVLWALRQARKARGVAGILSKVETKDDRQ